MEVRGRVTALHRLDESGEALFSRAFALHEQGRELGLVERLYREAVRLDAGHWEAWNNLGVLAYDRGELATALDAWSRALLARPDGSEVLYNIGVCFRDQGKPELARAYFERAVEVEPGHADSRVNLALALGALGRRRAALRHWTVYLRRWPGGAYEALALKHVGLLEAALGMERKSGHGTIGCGNFGD